MLQNYISESEGVLVQSNLQLLQDDSGCTLARKKTVKSNANLLAQTAERLKHNYNDRTLNSMINSRRMRTNSNQMSQYRKLQKDGKMGGWIGEFSSIVLSIGQKLIS